MKKKIKLLVCGLLLSVALVGCGSSENGSEPSKIKYKYYGGRKFLLIDYDTSFVYVDIDTKVQYLNFGYGHYANNSVLLDSDGKPILYEGEVE